MRPRQDAEAALGWWEKIGDGARGTCVFPADLPVFAGHFPRDPLVPGVYQLAAVVELCRRALERPTLVVATVARAKWTAPVRPGRNLVVTASWRVTDGEIVVD